MLQNIKCAPALHALRILRSHLSFVRRSFLLLFHLPTKSVWRLQLLACIHEIAVVASYCYSVGHVLDNFVGTVGGGRGISAEVIECTEMC